jgi:hypothetical protein
MICCFSLGELLIFFGGCHIAFSSQTGGGESVLIVIYNFAASALFSAGGTRMHILHFIFTSLHCFCPIRKGETTFRYLCEVSTYRTTVGRFLVSCHRSDFPQNRFFECHSTATFFLGKHLRVFRKNNISRCTWVFTLVYLVTNKDRRSGALKIP